MNVMILLYPSLLYTIISFTCFVVQPCLLSVSLFLILRTTFRDNCGGLPLLGLSFSPSIPSLSYLANQSDAHVLLLCNSLATRAGTISPYSTLSTRSNLSFTYGAGSFLYRLSNSVLFRAVIY